LLIGSPGIACQIHQPSGEGVGSFSAVSNITEFDWLEPRKQRTETILVERINVAERRVDHTAGGASEAPDARILSEGDADYRLMPRHPGDFRSRPFDRRHMFEDLRAEHTVEAVIGELKLRNVTPERGDTFDQ